MSQGSTALEQAQNGQLWKDAASIQAFNGELPTSRLRLYIDLFADDFEQGYPKRYVWQALLCFDRMKATWSSLESCAMTPRCTTGSLHSPIAVPILPLLEWTTV